MEHYSDGADLKRVMTGFEIFFKSFQTLIFFSLPFSSFLIIFIDIYFFLNLFFIFFLCAKRRMHAHQMTPEFLIQYFSRLSPETVEP